LNCVNDSDEEVSSLIDFVNINADVIRELRVLRYNECENSWWFESERYEEIVDRLRREVTVKVKAQESPGKEIKAACGMFHKL
jgi:adenine C2-methylase RlmN of 23S rRNA A2503 and tRNA A37